MHTPTSLPRPLWRRLIPLVGWLISWAAHAAYPDAVLTDRPTGYWKLTDLNSVAAVANAGSSGAGFAGLRSGTVQLGVPGLGTDTAASFDGNPAQFAVPFNLAHNRYYFSVEAWVRLPAIPNVDRCILSSIDLGVTGGYQLVITATGKWQFLSGRNGLGGDWEVLEVPATTATSWTHLVTQYDGTNKLFYVNGLLVAAARSPFFPNPAQPLRIGADTTGARPFLGLLAHVAVYDRALTAGAVGRHYTAGTGLSPSANVAPQILVQPSLAETPVAGSTVVLSTLAGGSAPLTYQWRKEGVSITGATTPVLTLANVQAAQQGNYTVTVKNGSGTQTSRPVTLTLAVPPEYGSLVKSDGAYAYWKLGEKPGSTVVHDSIPESSFPLPYDGFTWGTVRWGVPGLITGADSTAARFSAAAGSTINIDTAGELNSPQFTVELWARLTGGTGHYRSPMTMQDTFFSLAGFMFYAEPGDHWEFWSGKGSEVEWDIISGPAARLGQWDHLVATYDGSTKRFYVNGQLAGSSTAPYNAGFATLLRLGAGDTAGPGDFFFEGDIDEVAHYAYALPPERIAAHTAAGRPAPDTTGPVITPPSKTVFSAESRLGASVSLDVTADDANDGPVAITLDPPLEDYYPLGDTLVRATAHDAAGNTNSISFTVSVVDDQPPVISMLYKPYLEATSPDGAPLSIPFGAYDVVDGSVPVTLVPAAGSMLPLGNWSVVATAVDRAGNLRRQQFSIEVRDTTGPALTLPAEITAWEHDAKGTRVDFTATATDTVSEPVRLTYTPESGSLFPLGPTTVSVTATDARGNSRYGSFQVNVLPSYPQIQPGTQTIVVGEGGLATATGTYFDLGGIDVGGINASTGTVTKVDLTSTNGTWQWSLRIGNNTGRLSTQRVYISDSIHQNFANLVIDVQNLPPVARAISRTVPYNTIPEWIPLEATDPGGDPVTFQLTKFPPSWKGTVALLGGSTVVFTPAADFQGTTSFEYTATDNEGAVSAPATVTLFSSTPNHRPMAYTTNVVTSLQQSVAVTLPADDPDHDVLTFQILVAPAHGTLTGTAPQLTYTPAAGYQGADQFLFSVSDGVAGSDPAPVYLQIQGAALIGTLSFTNATTITIPAQGQSSPYGSPIQVAGLGGKISRVTVQLRGFTHSLPDDVDMLLVGPTGRKAIIFSDVGGTTPVTGLDLTLADAATVALPDATALTSGTFKPLNYGTGDTFNAPAPVGPYLAALNQFNNSIPNGVWTLYVLDDSPNHAGALAGGWSLTITTVAGVGVANADEPAPLLTLLPESLRSSLRLRVEAVQPGAEYRLEASRDLEVWTPRWQGLAHDTAFEVEAGVETAAAAGFFRLRRLDAKGEPEAAE